MKGEMKGGGHRPFSPVAETTTVKNGRLQSGSEITNSDLFWIIGAKSRLFE